MNRWSPVATQAFVGVFSWRGIGVFTGGLMAVMVTKWDDFTFFLGGGEGG